MTPLHRGRLLRLAEALENLEEPLPGLGFSMETFRESLYHFMADIDRSEPAWSPHNCDTVACLAGWACAMFDDRTFWRGSLFDIRDQAEKLLGLDPEQSQLLFQPLNSAAYGATPQQAARVVRYFVETGVVDWGKSGIPGTDRFVTVDEAQ